MANNEIRINIGTVRRHASEIRSSNSSLAAKGSSKVSAGTTNFTGYTLGVPCSGSMSRIMSSLTTKIDKDCDNLNSAAEAINKMDRHISGTIKKNKQHIK